MMKKVVFLIIVLGLLSILIMGCSSSESNSEPAAGEAPDETGQDAGPAAEAEITYDNIQTVAVPGAYPGDKFPLCTDRRDKVIKVYEGSNGALFDLKIVSTRGSEEIINEYADLWELENENTIFNDDLAAATLMGTAYGYEVIVNCSEQQPDKPAGAKTYCAILVEQKK
ncbi:MAG: hypothetical protein ACOWWO_09685 [Peptococcaceae bacterium]